MSEMVPLYGFGGGGGGTGATLTVAAPAGCTVTISKDGKSKTKVAGSDGVAVFKGLATGEWTVTITDGEQTAQKTVTITTDYATAMSFFTATINVTYPAGSTCTATDGVTTLTAPDTSGTWACVVSNAGTWTVSLSNGFSETVTISANGETQSLNKWYLYNRGDERTYITGGIRAVVNPTYGGTVNKNADNIYLGGTLAVAEGAALSTANSIDLSDFSKLCFNMTYAYKDNNYPEIGVKQSPALIEGNWTVTKALNSTGLETTVDIQSVPSGYPYVNAWASNATVYEIWLEV